MLGAYPFGEPYYGQSPAVVVVVIPPAIVEAHAGSLSYVVADAGGMPYVLGHTGGADTVTAESGTN